MITYIELAIAIISLILTIISTYLSFKQITSNSTQVYVDQRILQINPIYFTTNNYTEPPTNDQSINDQNKSFIILFLFLLHMTIIGIFYIHRLMECLDNGQSLVIAIIKTIILISIINILYSLFILFFFKNSNVTIFKNLLAMKYYSFKIITDIFLIVICCILLTKNFASNSVLLLNMTSIFSFTFIFQVTWFFFTLQKSFKLIKPTKLYIEMLKRIILYVPSYITPFIMFFIFLKNII